MPSALKLLFLVLGVPMIAGSVTLTKRALETLSLKAEPDGLFLMMPAGDCPRVTLLELAILLSGFL